MGTLDILKEYTPVNNTPPGALNNPQTQQTFVSGFNYTQLIEPAHMTFFPPVGPFTPAGIHEVSGQEFLAKRQAIFPNNSQIVSVPERPVDFGTYDAVVHGRKTGLQYNQPPRGVYNQNKVTTNSKAVAGTAPTSGIYTGFGAGGAFINSSGNNKYGDEG